MELVNQPPAAQRHTLPRAYWDSIAATAKTNPDQWVLVKDQNPGVASQIKNGRRAAFRPAGHYTATTRTHNNVTDIYVKYLGPVVTTETTNLELRKELP